MRRPGDSGERFFQLPNNCSESAVFHKRSTKKFFKNLTPEILRLAEVSLREILENQLNPLITSGSQCDGFVACVGAVIRPSGKQAPSSVIAALIG